MKNKKIKTNEQEVNQQMKKKLITEKELLEDITNLKTQLVDELSDIIDKYYIQMQEKKPEGLSRLKPIDIISVLELLKLNFYCEYKRILSQERNEMLNIPILKNNEEC